ncbi:hypothetical protein NDU88_005250 [Pleurodeles waltl]|uniref:Reverse transcriptase n=1 Tax=Pleurodeles waltl TaxID=8319 RepID=A0AAV7WU76_PLEWA|nr:hypothetical protein NDU88_005250 [Pleurodeles waltl]
MRLHDIWRLGHPKQREYSFYSAPHNTHTRIDIIWGTRDIGSLVSESEYLAKTLSDHAPLRVTLNWGRLRQAVPTWRFQAEALQDQAFAELLKESISQYWDINAMSATTRATEWDAHKVVVRGVCISSTWRVRRSLQAEIGKLEKELRAAEIAVALGEIPHTVLKERRLKYNDADSKLRCHDYNYHLTRLQTEGDGSSRMLAWLLREDRQQSPIGAIRVGAHDMATTQVEINETFRKYYSNLYTKRTSCTASQLEAFLTDSLLPQLSQTDREKIETPMTMDEIELALTQLPRNKAPGADGLPSEYYKAHLSCLKPHLLRVFVEALTNECLPTSQREAMIVVLPKQGRDPTDVKSYRPLSLLNLDCKILGKILANALIGTCRPKWLHSKAYHLPKYSQTTEHNGGYSP